MNKAKKYFILLFVLLLTLSGLQSCSNNNDQNDYSSPISFSDYLSSKEFNIDDDVQARSNQRYCDIGLDESFFSIFYDTEYLFMDEGQVAFTITTDKNEWVYLTDEFSFSNHNQILTHIEEYGDQYLLEGHIDIIQIKELGFSPIQGFKIGDSLGTISNNTNISFGNLNWYDLLSYKPNDNLVFDFIFVNNIFVSFYIVKYNSDVVSDSVLNIQKNKLNDALKYFNDIGDLRFPTSGSNLEYDEIPYYLDFYESSFTKFYFDDPTVSDFKRKYVYVENCKPYRIVDWYQRLFWENDSFTSPLKPYLGKWIATVRSEAIYLDLKGISDYGEIVFDIETPTAKLSNLTSTLYGENNTNPLLLQDTVYYGGLDYFDGKYYSGIIQYGGLNRNADSISIKLSEHTIVITQILGANNVSISAKFDKKISEHDNYNSLKYNGYMSNFGRNDPDLDKNIMMIKEDSSERGKKLINDCFNSYKNTENVNYADYYFEYLYDYYNEYLDTLFCVYRDASNSFYYIDISTDTIILEDYINYNLPRKRVIWTHSQKYRSTYSFRGNYAIEFDGSGISNIIFNDDGTLSLTLVDTPIVSLENISYSYHDYYDSEWMQTCSFSYTDNMFDLYGYFVFNYLTFDTTLHITESNIPNIKLGLYNTKRNGDWTYQDFIPTFTSDEIKEKIDESSDGTYISSVQTIKDFYGRVIGKIEIKNNGDQIGYDFYGRIVGYYNVSTNKTENFYHVVVGTGNLLAMLIAQANV